MSDETGDGVGQSGRVPDRRVLLVAGLAASLLLGGGAFLLVGGEEPVDEVVFAVPRRPAVAAVPPTPAPAPSAAGGRRHAEPVNPFLPGVRSAPAPTDPTSAPLAEPPGATPPTGLPTTPGTTAPPSPAAVPPSAPAGPAVPPSAPPAPPTSGPTSTPPAPARHSLVLTRVSGTAPDLRGRFLVDGEAQLVTAGDDAPARFGPGAVVALLGLEETGEGWVAVVQIGSATPVNLPAGEVLRFG